MSNTGRMKYVPKKILEQLGYIKQRNGYKKDREAWRKISNLIDVGYNVDEFYSGLFGVKRK